MELKIVRWLIDQLIPYAKNARTHSPDQIAQVAASITEFGFVNPILVGADKVIIAGPRDRGHRGSDSCGASRPGRGCALPWRTGRRELRLIESYSGMVTNRPRASEKDTGVSFV
jgi:ParB-like nuclease domain